MLDPLLERREGSGEREGGEWRERGRGVEGEREGERE